MAIHTTYIIKEVSEPGWEAENTFRVTVTSNQWNEYTADEIAEKIFDGRLESNESTEAWRTSPEGSLVNIIKFYANGVGRIMQTYRVNIYHIEES